MALAEKEVVPDLSTYEYKGTGYFRDMSIPKGQTAPLIHGPDLLRIAQDLQKSLEESKLNAIRMRDNFNTVANRYNLAHDWAESFAKNPLGKVKLESP